MSGIKLKIEKLNNRPCCLLYTIMLCVYTIYCILSSTYVESFLVLSLSTWGTIIRYSNLLILCIVFFLQEKISFKKFVAIILVTCLIGAVSYSVFDMTLFFSYLFVITFPVDISLKKLANSLFSCYAVVIIGVVLFSWMGGIQDYTIFQHGVTRHSWGFASPNSFSNSVTMALMLYVYSNFENWKFRKTIGCIVPIIFVYSVTSSRLAFGIGILTVFVTQIFVIKKTIKVTNVIYCVASYIFAIFSGLCIYFTILFSSQKGIIFESIDMLFTGRLSWMILYYKKYGIHLLGQLVITVSRKQAEVTGTSWSGIDNAYILIAIKFGYLLIIGLAVVYFLLGKYLKKKNDLAGAIYVVMICLVGLTENFLIIIGYNFSLLLIAEMFSSRKVSSKRMLENNDAQNIN